MLARPLRIVHITPATSGAAWMAAFLREQKRLGHDVAAIFPPGDGTLERVLAADGITTYRVPVDSMSCGVVRGWRVVFENARLLRRIQPDVVISHILQANLTARLSAWLAGVPLRFAMNCGPWTLEAPALRELEIGTAWLDTTSIVSCEYSRRLLIEAGIPPASIALIYYAAVPDSFNPATADGARVRRELGIAPGRPVVGHVAHFYAPATNAAAAPPNLLQRGPKGQDVLVRAIPRVLAEFPDAMFVLTGSAWDARGAVQKREVEQLARTLGIAHSVIFTDGRSDIPDVLASFDVSVHPSLNDNVGGTIESLRMARPMVVSNVGGLIDTVRHEQTGLVVPPDDPDALADGILRLLRDPAYARHLGEAGRQLMLERFSLERTISDFEALFARESAALTSRPGPMTRAARAVALPFQLLPVYLRTVKRLDDRPLARRLLSRLKGAIKRVLRPAGEPPHPTNAEAEG